jgi:hypothetical protein
MVMNVQKQPIWTNETFYQCLKRHSKEFVNDIWCITQVTFWSFLLTYPLIIVAYWRRPDVVERLLELLK